MHSPYTAKHFPPYAEPIAMSLKHAILILLESEPGSGYDLVKRFKAGLGYFWNAKHQQVYLELKKLSEAGWLDCQAQAQETRPDKKVYRLTPSGHAELLRWLEQGAVLAVCGSLQGMAAGVDEVLLELLGREGLEQLQDSGRYRRDVY